jgi:hypothetical protein
VELFERLSTDVNFVADGVSFAGSFGVFDPGMITFTTEFRAVPGLQA